MTDVDDYTDEYPETAGKTSITYVIEKLSERAIAVSDEIRVAKPEQLAALNEHHEKLMAAIAEVTNLIDYPFSNTSNTTPRW